MTYNAQQVDKSSSDNTQVTRYECNAFIDTTQPMLDNVEEILTTMRGGLITGDKYQLIQDKQTTALNVHINDDKIIGNIAFLQGSKRTLLNSIRAKFPDKEDPFNYQRTSPLLIVKHYKVHQKMVSFLNKILNYHIQQIKRWLSVS